MADKFALAWSRLPAASCGGYDIDYDFLRLNASHYLEYDTYRYEALT